MANQVIKKLESQSKDTCSSAIKLARIYAALEEKEIAYSYLEQAVEQHEVDLIGIESDPRWAIIHYESRFKEIVRKTGFPDD
jgi:hypothetical protein